MEGIFFIIQNNTLDSLTQIVLGAATGEAVLGKKVGNKAMLWGAIGGTIPDLDLLVGNFFHPLKALEIHRGFSHSIAFDILMAPLLGGVIYGLYKLKKNNEATFKDWSWLMFWTLFTHPLLDCHTTWGTQLFWPLEYRVAYKNIFVIDPLYTLPFIIFTLLAMRLNRNNPNRKKWNWLGIGVSSFYMMITIFIKLHINSKFEKSFINQQLNVLNYDTKPTPLNTILWSANVETDHDFYIGYYSLFDKSDSIKYKQIPKQHQLLQGWEENEYIIRIKRLTEGYYTVSKSDDTLVMNDLRFGQLTSSKFVFAYKLYKTKNNEVIFEEQRQNPKEGIKLLKQLFTRILGK